MAMNTEGPSSAVDQASLEGVRQERYAPPPGATTVLLVRHGESEAAHPDRPFPLVDGHGDPALHPNGRAQAERVGARLAQERVDAIYVTSLRRTHQTAAPLAAALGLVPIVEAGLREVHLGEWEGGMFRFHMAAGHPAALQMRAEQRWDAVPGGEPAAVFQERTQSAFLRIVAAHPGGRVVAVVHGGVIGQLLHHASGSQPFAFLGAENTSISEIVVTAEGQQILRRFNDASHLDDT